VKYGEKSVSLKIDDPYEITLERALEVIREKEIADANRLILDFPDAGIQVLNGRYGPYITDKERNAKIPKDREPKSLTLVECQALLAAAPLRTFGRWGKKNAQGKNAKGKTAKGKTATGKAANGVAKAPDGKTTGAKTPGAKAPGSAGGGGIGVATAAKSSSSVPGLAARAAAVGKAGTARLAAKGAKTAADKKAPVSNLAAGPSPKAGSAKPRPAKAGFAPRSQSSSDKKKNS
jgi:DNA topoisomerase-1